MSISSSSYSSSRPVPPTPRLTDDECAEALVTLASAEDQKLSEPSSSSSSIQQRIYGPPRNIEPPNRKRKSKREEALPLFSRTNFNLPTKTLHQVITKRIGGNGDSQALMSDVFGMISSSNKGTRSRNERRLYGKNVRSRLNSKTQRRMNAVANAILDNEERFLRFVPKSGVLFLKNGKPEERFLQFDNGKFTGPIQRLQNEFQGLGNKLSDKNLKGMNDTRKRVTKTLTQAVLDTIGQEKLLKALEQPAQSWRKSLQPAIWLNGKSTPPNTTLRFLQFLREGFIEVYPESEESSKSS